MNNNCQYTDEEIKRLQAELADAKEENEQLFLIIKKQAEIVRDGDITFADFINIWARSSSIILNRYAKKALEDSV